MYKMTDPTRGELIAFIEAAYPVITCGETVCEGDCPDGCGCRFEVEEAAYWAAVHCHGGQGSNLYTALCASPYSPGPSASDLPDDEERMTASDLYREAVCWITGVDSFDDVNN